MFRSLLDSQTKLASMNQSVVFQVNGFYLRSLKYLDIDTFDLFYNTRKQFHLFPEQEIEEGIQEEISKGISKENRKEEVTERCRHYTVHYRMFLDLFSVASIDPSSSDKITHQPSLT